MLHQTSARQIREGVAAYVQSSLLNKTQRTYAEGIEAESSCHAISALATVLCRKGTRRSRAYSNDGDNDKDKQSDDGDADMASGSDAGSGKESGSDEGEQFR